MIRSLKTLLISSFFFALIAQSAPAPVNSPEYVEVLTQTTTSTYALGPQVTVTPGRIANTTSTSLLGSSSSTASSDTTTRTTTITISSTITVSGWPNPTSTTGSIATSAAVNQQPEQYQAAPVSAAYASYVSPEPASSPVAAGQSVTLPVGSTQSSSSSSNSGGWVPKAPLKNVSSSDSFEDGVFDCNQVPDIENVIRVSTTSGGWSSIQNPNKKDYGADFDCTDGNYCSYACEAGFLKTQWPSEQPTSGVSVGGLICKNGKLYKSRPEAPTLCIPGTGTLIAKNKLSQQVAICRTDYPGSEDVNVPTSVNGGSSADIAVVDSDSYYKTFKGLSTSSHYYVNKAGVSAQEGCAWNYEGSGKGNWAPIILGAGTTGFGTDKSQNWFSLAYNPENKTPVDTGYKVRFVAADGGNLSQKCEYANGIFNGDASLTGCTVAAPNGAFLEFY